MPDASNLFCRAISAASPCRQRRDSISCTLAFSRLEVIVKQYSNPISNTMASTEASELTEAETKETLSSRFDELDIHEPGPQVTDQS